MTTSINQFAVQSNPLRQFAERRRLKVRRDPDDGTDIVVGRRGHIYEYSENELGVMFMPPKTENEPWGKWMPRTWGKFRRAAIAIGMTVRQNGDSEGCLSFDPDNKEHVRLAMKIAKVRPKRTISPERAAAMVATLAKFRSKAKQEGGLAC